MRKLELQVQMTLDGFVAGPNGEQKPLELDNSVTYKNGAILNK
jgi:hypothetical protein